MLVSLGLALQGCLLEHTGVGFDWAVFTLTLRHFAIRVSVYLCVQFLKRGRRPDLIVGVLTFCVGAAGLSFVSTGQATGSMGEGRAVLYAWSIAAFLLFAEVAIPFVFGYIFAAAHGVCKTVDVTVQLPFRI